MRSGSFCFIFSLCARRAKLSATPDGEKVVRSDQFCKRLFLSVFYQSNKFRIDVGNPPDLTISAKRRHFEILAPSCIIHPSRPFLSFRWDRFPLWSGENPEEKEPSLSFWIGGQAAGGSG